ncbi:MAG: TlpA disulfide reductase family protein [Nitrospirota bacterium]
MKITIKLLFFVCLFFLTAMGPFPSRDSGKSKDSPFEIDRLENGTAPEFDLKDINGRAFSLSSLRGRVVFLNFWATWCPPCKSEMPLFNRLYMDYKSRGFEIIAVSTDTSINYVKEYLSKNSFDFRILWDGKRDVTKKYKVFTLPTTFLIDRKGIIVEKFLGEYDWTDPEIRKKIEKLLSN